MTEEVDTGFDAVIAGEKWEGPASEMRDDPTIAACEIKPAPSLTTHVCASATGTRCDTCFGPVTATVIEPAGFTAAGLQAAKSLINLPDLSPSQLAHLAREFAMDIKERHVILKAHGLNDVQYDFIEKHNPFYRHALHQACVEWHAPLSTQDRIKVEAAAILEESLIGLGARMQNKAEGLPGVIEAAKLFAKVAGVGEREVGSGNIGERFTINIDLGGDQKVNISATPTSPSPAGALVGGVTLDN